MASSQFLLVDKKDKKNLIRIYSHCEWNSSVIAVEDEFYSEHPLKWEF